VGSKIYFKGSNTSLNSCNSRWHGESLLPKQSVGVSNKSFAEDSTTATRSSIGPSATQSNCLQKGNREGVEVVQTYIPIPVGEIMTTSSPIFTQCRVILDCRSVARLQWASAGVEVTAAECIVNRIRERWPGPAPSVITLPDSRGNAEVESMRGYSIKMPESIIR